MAFDMASAKPEAEPKQGFDMGSAIPEKPADPNTPWYEDLSRGIAESTLRTGLGAYEMFGGELSDTQKKAMELMRRDVDASGGWGTAGNVVGELAQFALPAAALAKGVKLAGKGAKTLLAADIGLSAGLGATALPQAGRTRKEGAVSGAFGALGGGVLGAGLRKAVKGVNVTDAAKRLLDKGMYLTPDKATKSVFPRAAAYAMQVTPFLAKGVREAGEESTKSMNKVLLNSVTPSGKITEVGAAGIKQLKTAFSDAYTAAWAKASKPSGNSLVNIINEGVEAGTALGGGSGMTIKKILGDIKNLSGGNFSTGALKELDNTFRTSIESAAKKGEDALHGALVSMRAKLRKAAGAEANTALKAVDSKYGDFIAVRDAGSALSSMKAGGVIDADTLMGGVKSAGGKTRSATGDAPQYDFAQDVINTIGLKTPNPIIDIMKGISVNTPTVLPLRTMGQTLIGKTAPQKFMQKGYDSKVAEALRNLGLRGSIGGAAYE